MYSLILFLLSIKIVRFVHLQSIRDFPFPFLITYLIHHLILFIVTFGVPILFLLLMDTNTSLLLLMIVLDQLGFISWSPSLIVDPFYSLFMLWSKLNSTNPLKFLELTMLLNFKWLTSLRLMASYTNIVVLLLHNKILLWRGNINIFCVLQEPYEFNQMFLLPITLWQSS